MLRSNRSVFRRVGLSVAAVSALALLAGCSGGGGSGSGAPTVESIKDAGVLRVATLTDDAPWVSVGANGKQEGFDVELAHALADDLGVKVKFTTVDGPGRVASLQSKKVDLTIGEFSNTPERDEVIDFSEDYVLNPGQYMVLADSGIETKEDLNDASKVACIQQGGTSTDLVPADLPDVDTLFLPGTDDCLEALNSGQADAMTQTPFYYLPLMEKSPDKYKILEGPSFGTNHIAVGLQSGSTELAKYVNSFLKEYYESGKLESSFDQWFGFEMPADALPEWFEKN
ncbi:substrate-binding periplasmic protein [Paramicrobacterium chengjingii]|uniref:substrate-binding periplasmic protein n=1 Tax=Paramicrobacterium chengjingii TaxID=2769067 RepID=UPI0014234359|nr:transporter substrate-binding domain-containing protein [Microbacterium chengjingii]